MVKVNVGTMSAQASSVSAIVSQRVSALTDAKQSLSSFASQDQLKGAAYQNAKAYATSVLGPLIDGMILLSEETEKGVTKLQTLYAEKCGSESLDSEVLTDKIEKDQELLIKIQDLQAHLEKHASFLSHALDGLEATVKARLRKNKKKLKNLMEFNAESSSVFEALAEFQDSVSTGLSFVSKGFNNFNGTFDTSGKGLEWTKTIQTGMKKREDKVSIDQNSLLEETKKAYKAGKIDKQTYQSIKSGLVNSSAAFLKELAKAKITDKAVETFTEESWEALSKNLQTMQLSGVLATVNGVELSTAIDVNPSYANFIRESSKFVKYGAPVIGAAVDFGLQLKDGEDVGDAAVKTGVHSAIGLAGAAVGGPAGFIIGVGVSMAFDFVYDNYKDNIIDSVNNFANNLGNSVNDLLSDLNPAYK
ncbi:hypothetical protein [Streptococcus uberis]|uniref:hypothetical protein n=1 Tax=Streptococcus uberis TaxID=1349 RepID=UPI0012B619D7|nr:hypothetical protein [Streptococcus uberis]MBI0907768.1 hypothetical protein [Streptococcus uberis]MCK1194283.1 hypothetical protein [Streptococcus uberis]MCK1198250.1 hypothetical protein [Streptococcus uberis]MTB69264.1 hypothetical protein [Streptococcus uberis]